MFASSGPLIAACVPVVVVLNVLDACFVDELVVVGEQPSKSAMQRLAMVGENPGHVSFAWQDLDRSGSTS